MHIKRIEYRHSDKQTEWINEWKIESMNEHTDHNEWMGLWPARVRAVLEITKLSQNLLNEWINYA